ncbi:MAG: aminopeptidase P family protein [Candidatus Dadabacteria bacterium]|nr:MAG: aminopeptidase P family protein [Candidatus Dadabacteria bacterium]
MANIFQRRLKKVISQMKRSGCESALLLASRQDAPYSRDTFYPYRPDSDIRYLTGFTGRDLTLVVSTKKPGVLIIVPPRDELKVKWIGKPPNYAKLADTLGCKAVVSDDPTTEIRKALKGIDLLYYSPLPGTPSYAVVKELFDTPFHRRKGMPFMFVQSEFLLKELRLYKSSDEIKAIKKAAAITNESLFDTVPFITDGAWEREIAETINYMIKLRGGGIAFNTIVASGKSAATLHYERLDKRLRTGDMLLIDCGASYDMYCADISRVLPVRGRFSDNQRKVYTAVLSAQKAAIRAVKDGVLLKTVYRAAAKVLANELKNMGILRGSLKSIMDKGSYKEFFPHGIGHSLGIDVHDVGSGHSPDTFRLRKGMVFTIEPGLYFDTKTGSIPPCGVRIEDDVLVTDDGCTVLSKGFPKEPDEIEELMNRR